MACDLRSAKHVARIISTSVAAIALAGCASIEAVRPDIAAKPLPSRLDEIALINELRSAYVVLSPHELERLKTDAATTDSFKKGETAPPESLCFNGAGLVAFKSKSGQGYREQPDPENEGIGCIRYRNVPSGDEGKAAINRYITAGFTLTDIYCQRFFTVAAAAERNRNFGRTISNGVDTLVGSVLTLTGAGRSAIGITNAGFGLVDDGFEAYDAAYLVGPDLAEVRRLVAGAQAKYRSEVITNTPTATTQTFAGARSIIERYASLCSYTGMKELVDISVKDKTDQLNQIAEGKGGQSTVGVVPPADAAGTINQPPTDNAQDKPQPPEPASSIVVPVG